MNRRKFGAMALAALGLGVIMFGACHAAEPDARLHLSIIGDRGDAQFHRLIAWYHSGALANRVRYHEITTNTAVYRERYAPNIKGLPTVRVQQPDGVVIYEKSGNDLPASAGALSGEISASILTSQLAPWRQRSGPLRDKLRKCCPLRRQQAEPVEEEEEPVEETVLLPVAPPPPQYPWLPAFVIVCAGLAGLVGGGVWQAVETYQKSQA